MIYFWAAAVVFFLLIEVITPQLTTVWFALGAAAALIACALDASQILQIIIFVIVTAIALAATRPLAKKLTKKTAFNPTNADRCIGKSAKVVEEIDNLKEEGAVKINGVVWSARSQNGEIIAKNELVTIKEINGVKLIVIKE